MNAQSENNTNNTLDEKQRSIVGISSYTANGDLQNLKTALNIGLDKGLTINEIKEGLVQLYAYCGFPRSLNAISTLMAVVEERKAKGLSDIVGADASPITDAANKYEIGRQNLEKLTLRPETGPKQGTAAFAPVIDVFLKEHLFADIFSRDILTFKERELITITALTTMTGLEPQLLAHLGMGINVGITELQFKEMFSIIEPVVGKQQTDAGRQTLSKALAARK